MTKNRGARCTNTSDFCMKWHYSQGAVKVLLDRDFITNEDGSYYVYDHFFSLWLSLE